MKKFLVLYRAPLNVMEEWMKTDPATRKEAEEKMQRDWKEWNEAHADTVAETAGVGKTKTVNANGVQDSRNDIMLYSIATAQSQEEAAAMFEGHPHFGITGATIEIMAINPLQGM